MATLDIRPHEGTVAATATAGPGNTGYDSDTGAGTAPTYVSTSLIGSSAIQFTGGGAAARQLIRQLAARCSVIGVRITANVTSPITFLRKRDSGGTALAQCRITNARQMDLRDGSATVDTSTFALSNNVWYQVVFDVASAAGTIQIWSADGQTLHETVTGTVGSGSVFDTQIGQLTGSGNTVILDQHVFADTLIGPYIRPPSPSQRYQQNTSMMAAVQQSVTW